jgi:small subunit ribosomal protein S16
VAVKIKLKRLGKIREPYYRIVVADARTKRDGRAIEEIGKYHPKADPSLIEVNSERVQHWLSVGAQPTDPVRALLKVTGDWQKFTGEPGTEGTLRVAAPREDRKERFAAAAKASQATKEKEDQARASAGKGGTASRAKSAQGSRAKAASAKAEDAPAQAAPSEAAPSEAASSEAASSEAVSSEAVSSEAVSSEAVSSEAGAAAADASGTEA